MYVKKSTLKMIGEIAVKVVLFSSGAIMAAHGVNLMCSVIKDFVKE